MRREDVGLIYEELIYAGRVNSADGAIRIIRPRTAAIFTATIDSGYDLPGKSAVEVAVIPRAR